MEITNFYECKKRLALGLKKNVYFNHDPNSRLFISHLSGAEKLHIHNYVYLINWLLYWTTLYTE